MNHAVLFVLSFIQLYAMSECASSWSNAALAVVARSDRLQEDFRASGLGEGGGLGKDGDLPFLTVAYAQTIDGSIAPLNRTRLEISSMTSFQMLHSLRAKHEGVLIGINTVICDAPRLNVRECLPTVDTPEPDRMPRPIVIDSDLRILDVKDLLLKNPVVFTSVEMEEEEGVDAGIEDRKRNSVGDINRSANEDQNEDTEGGESGNEISERGSQSVSKSISRSSDHRWLRAKAMIEAIGGDLVHVERGKDGRCDLRACMVACKEQLGIQSVLIEGGANILTSVFELRLAHQVLVTIKPSFFGGFRSMATQIHAPVTLRDVTTSMVEGDIVVHGAGWCEN